MIDKKNMYLGTYSNENFAAKIYDVIAIKKDGLQAKTNFKYKNEVIKRIYNLNIDINNIFEIACNIYN